jgi:adenosylhomocysteine nucleosidase
VKGIDGAGHPAGKKGLVVALPAEARVLAGKGWRSEDGRQVLRMTAGPGDEWLCVRCGVGPGRAGSAARWLIGQKVTSLAVLGVSGGLAPGLASGRLVVAERVIDKTAGGKFWPCKGSDGLLKVLAQAGIAADRGLIVTVPEPVLDPEAKSRLHRETGALAVDMESAAVARAAAEAGLNCVILRAVCDAADRRVPPALYQMVDGDGHLRISILLRELVRRPGLIVDLLAMQRDFSRALKALGRGGAALGLKAVCRRT